MNPAEVWLAYNAAENRQDSGAMNTLVATDLAVSVNGRATVSSAADDAIAMAHLLTVYPDYRREVDEVFSIGDRAVARWRMHGTASTSEFTDLAIAGCSIITAVDDQITAAHLYYDGDALDLVLSQAFPS